MEGLTQNTNLAAAYYFGDRRFEVKEGTAGQPGEDEVSVKVGYVGICGTDMHIYHGAMDQRVSPPQIIGHEMSGTVVAVGSGVQGFNDGDRVVVRPLDYCGECPACDAGHSHICHNLSFMGIDSPGAMQSIWTVKARTLHHLPDSVSMQHAALIEPLAVACHDVQRSRLQKGEKAVVLGGGPIGQLIAQVGVAMGAEVLVSEISDVRRAFAVENGIDVVNPVEDDIVQYVNEWTGGKGADVVFEVSGAQAAVDVMTAVTAARGRICMVAIHGQKPAVDLFQFFWKELELVGARVYEHEDFERAISIVANKELNLDPYITSVTPLARVGEAFAEMDGNPNGMKALIDCCTQEEV